MSGTSTLAGPLRADASWTAVASVGIGAFALVTTEFLPVGLLPQMAADLGVSTGQAGLLVTLPGLVAAVAAPLTLAFAGHIDRRRVLLALIALLIVANLAVAAAPGFAMVLVGRVLLGIAIGGFWTVGGSLGPQLRPGSAAQATSLIFAGVSIGTVAGVPLGTFVGSLAGWRTAFIAAAGVALLVMALLVVALPSIRPQAAGSLAGVKDVLALRKVRIGVAAILLLFLGQFGAYTYITPYLVERAHVAPAAIGAVLFGYGVAGFCGNLLAGWAAGRSVSATLAGTAALMGIAVLLLLGAESTRLAIGPVLAWGLAFGMLPIAVQAWLFSAAPERLEALSALFTTSGQASIGAGAFVGGLVADHAGLPAALGLGVAGGMLTAVLIVGTRGERVKRNA